MTFARQVCDKCDTVDERKHADYQERRVRLNVIPPAVYHFTLIVDPCPVHKAKCETRV